MFVRTFNQEGQVALKIRLNILYLHAHSYYINYNKCLYRMMLLPINLDDIGNKESLATCGRIKEK